MTNNRDQYYTGLLRQYRPYTAHTMPAKNIDDYESEIQGHLKAIEILKEKIRKLNSGNNQKKS